MFYLLNNCLEEGPIRTKLWSFCLNSCLNDCEFRYYTFTLKENLSFGNDQDSVEVSIDHNNLPDILVKSIPEMTFMSFVCNFGGLLGMWLGISILLVFEEICKTISKLLLRSCGHNITYNFNLNIFKRSENRCQPIPKNESLTSCQDQRPVYFLKHDHVNLNK